MQFPGRSRKALSAAAKSSIKASENTARLEELKALPKLINQSTPDSAAIWSAALLGVQQHVSYIDNLRGGPCSFLYCAVTFVWNLDNY